VSALEKLSSILYSTPETCSKSSILGLVDEGQADGQGSCCAVNSVELRSSTDHGFGATKKARLAKFLVLQFS
jgi:hypothetical protein